MTADKLKKYFLFQLCVFSAVSFIVFSPLANILFSIPQNVQGQYGFDSEAFTGTVTPSEAAQGYTPATLPSTGSSQPPSSPVAYGVGMTICAAAKATGMGIGLMSEAANSAISVPIGAKVTSPSTYGQLFEQLSTCATEIANNKVIKWVAESLEYAAMAALNALLADLTNQMIKCINSYDPKTGKCDTGGKGWVLDFNKYLEDAAQIAGAKFLNSLSGVNLCSITPSLKLKVALLPVPEFKTRAECTLDQIVGNIENFYADFRNGGWLAWKESLSPNNNAFGTYLMALDKKMADEFAAMQKAEKEVSPGGMKATKRCLTPSGADPNSADCVVSAVVSPSGTVETAVNFAAVSPIRTLEMKLAATYAKAGPFDVYLTAISNALLNRMAGMGMEALLGVVTQQDLDTNNPYQSIMNETSANSGSLTVAQGTQAQTNLVITTLQLLDTFITNQAKPHYIELIGITTNIKTYQDKIINEFWAQGVFGDSTAIIASGPTTNTIEISPTVTQQTTTTIYNVSNLKVGNASVEKKEIIYTDTINPENNTTQIIYTLLSKQNQIEDIDGAITKYTTKLNSLSQTQSQTVSARTITQAAYDKISAYLNTWNGTSGNAEAKSAMDTAVTDAINFYQDSTKWTPPSQQTSFQGISNDITTLSNNTTADVTKDVQDGVKDSYDQYLTDVQTIYNSLVPPVIEE